MKVKEKTLKWSFNLFLLFLLLAWNTIGISASTFYNNDNLDYSQEVFYFDTYQVEINIDSHASISLNYNFKTIFNQAQHGLYFKIDPNYYFNQRKYHFPFFNLKVEGDSYTSDLDDEEFLIKIGSSSRYVQGEKNYSLSYQSILQDLNIENQDLVYYNLLGENKGKIKKLKFKVNFEKATDLSNLELYLGRVNGQKNILDFSEIDNFVIDQNHFEGEINDVDSYTALTMYLPLEKSYFTYSQNDQNPIFLFFIFGLAIISIITIVLAYKFQRSQKLIVISQKHQLDTIHSYEVKSILNQSFGIESLVAMIFELANLKYLKLDYQTDTKKLNIIKIKDYDGKNPDFQLLFSEYLDSHPIIDLSQKNIDLTKVYQKLESRLTNRYANGLFKFRKSLRNILFLLSFILIFGINFILIDKSFYGVDSIFLVVFMYVLPNLLIYFLSLWTVKKVEFKFNKLVPIIVLALVIDFVASIIIKNWNFYRVSQELIFGGLIIYSGLLITLACLVTKTDNFIDKASDILSVKHFIEVTEEQRIKLLIKDYPNLFFDILPYAYVFNLTQIWLDKFKNLDLNINNQYDSVWNHYFLSARMLDSMYYSLNNDYNSYISSSNKGGKFSGGGFSGGGFSGGGAGGMSGGSW